MIDELVNIEIPMKRYVASYVRTMLGPSLVLANDPLIFAIMVPNFKAVSNWKNKLVNLDSFPEVVNVRVSVDFIKHNGCTLTKTQIFNINKSIELLIKRELNLYYTANRLQRCHHKRAAIIRQYQHDFGFKEDDFSTETIIKHIQRHIPALIDQHKPIHQYLNNHGHRN
jgi:ribosomal protein L17